MITKLQPAHHLHIQTGLHAVRVEPKQERLRHLLLQVAQAEAQCCRNRARMFRLAEAEVEMRFC